MEYLLKSTAVLSIFYVFYKIFLQNETFFKSIRIYFLIGFLSAILIPLITISKFVTIAATPIPEYIAFNSITPIIESNTMEWSQILLMLYVVGVIFFTIRFFTQLGSLLWFLYKNSKIKNGKYYMITTKKYITPFSFFNYIVYNPAQFKDLELKHILKHEKIHVNQLHSMDTILSQLMVILNWFNPLIWLFDKEVQKNLEFIADEFAFQLNKEKKHYQYLLLKTIWPNYQMALTNNFYNSLIKKRINMLHKNRSSKTMYIKFTLIIPMLIAFIFTFNTKVIAQHKVVKTIEIQQDESVEIITKEFTKIQLEQLKTRLSTKGITFKFKKLKYNNQNEITAINISVKNEKGSEANISQKGNEPIESIKIKIDNETGAIALGNIKGLHTSKLLFTSKGSGEIKKIHIKKGNEKNNVFVIVSDSTKIVQSGDDDEFVFFSGSDSGANSRYIVKSEIVEGDDIDKMMKIWILKGSDAASSESIEIVRINGDDDIIVGSEVAEKHKVIVKRINPDKKNIGILIQSDDESKGEHQGNRLLIDANGKKPLFFINGKEIEDGKLDDIDPDKIKNISVLKGKSATKLYGEKAKNGVILIETKK
ncbi:MAG: TonB-dependent receptor plug domain-containing protein [Flavobacteriaceae bacterium]|nr:TonB-dependent receptor plug domain-containing protein [Flavobacteriaceae bacterium]